MSAPSSALPGTDSAPDYIDKPDSVDALREVNRRFLGAYAPLTVEDLAQWWGVAPARGARMLATLGEEAVEVDVEGQRAWVLARDVHDMASARSPKAAQLLPAFDPWVVGASRRAAALFEPGHKARIYRGQGWISPGLLVNGRMVGVWRQARQGRRLLVEIDPFGRLPAWARAQLETEYQGSIGSHRRHGNFDESPIPLCGRRAGRSRSAVRYTIAPYPDQLRPCKHWCVVQPADETGSG
jgi:hypothetical protein